MGEQYADLQSALLGKQYADLQSALLGKQHADLQSALLGKLYADLQSALLGEQHADFQFRHSTTQAQCTGCWRDFLMSNPFSWNVTSYPCIKTYCGLAGLWLGLHMVGLLQVARTSTNHCMTLFIHIFSTFLNATVGFCLR